MLPKPKPKKALHVSLREGCLHITPHTEDAKAFLKKEGPTFGRLQLHVRGRMDLLPPLGEYTLIPFQVYSAEEVRDYLDSYNKSTWKSLMKSKKKDKK